MLFKILLLAALVRANLHTGKFLFCSSLYAVTGLVLALVSGGELLPTLLWSAIAFGLATLYFWLLVRLEDSGIVWWVVLVGGLLIGLV